MGKYDDIIDLPHYRSPYRRPMPVENRAAQFAPFAALTGHEEAILETYRLTDKKIPLTDEEKFSISRSLSHAHTNGRPVSITYFIHDKTKSGGFYTETTGRVAKINEVDKTITLSAGVIIPMEEILSITFSTRKK